MGVWVIVIALVITTATTTTKIEWGRLRRRREVVAARCCDVEFNYIVLGTSILQVNNISQSQNRALM